MRLKSKAYIRYFVGVLTAFSMCMTLAQNSFAQPSHESVSYEEDGAVSEELHMPIYHWSIPHAKPRGVVLAIHGVAMHGFSFDTLGRSLALEGFDVYATDLHGYGHYMKGDHAYCEVAECSRPDCKGKIDYDKSYEDIRKLAQYLKTKEPIPLFAVGESLGGALTIRLASRDPNLVDGVILSAPAIKRHSFIDPCLVASAGLFLANPRAQLDLMPFVRRYSSDDPRVVAEKECDPLLRRHLSAYELLLASKTVRKTASYVENIPSTMPVLVLQGGGDRCLKAQAVMLLLSKLHSRDQTVKWFAERGHILIETAFVKPDTMGAVVQWLNTHVESQVQASVSQPPLTLTMTNISALYDGDSDSAMTAVQH